jgi:apolipoprotein N-acyltransferase
MLTTLAALLFSGLAQATISPPLSWIWLHPFSWVPAIAVFARLQGRRAVAAGLVVGAAANLAIFYWVCATVMRFGGFAAPAAAVVWILFAVATGAYTAVFAWGVAGIRRLVGGAWPVAISAWFVALEFLNPHLFPYIQGVAWYQVPEVFLVVALAGVPAVSFAVMLANCVLLQALECARGRASPGALAGNAAFFAATLAVAVGYSSARLDTIDDAERDAAVVRIAVVQPLHTVERRRLLRSVPEGAARDLVALSRKVLEAGLRPDVFVWPEGALSRSPEHPSNRAVLEFLAEAGAELWTGANHFELRDGRRVEHNAAFRVTADGRIDRRYDKNILVPFGEYVPLRDVVPGFDRIPAVANFEPGDHAVHYEAGPTRFAFLICYEAIMNAFVRRSLAPDTNLLVNLTVDAWYGDSSEQTQHLMLAAIQSALHGLPLVRSTTTGISAVTDARGLLLEEAGNFTREVLVRDVRPVRVPSPYSRWGDWFAWLCVAASAVMVAGSIAVRQRG